MGNDSSHIMPPVPLNLFVVSSVIQIHLSGCLFTCLLFLCPVLLLLYLFSFVALVFWEVFCVTPCKMKRLSLNLIHKGRMLL